MSNDTSPAAIWCICFANMMLLPMVAMMRCLPSCAVRHTSLGVAVIIGEANIICRRQTSFKKATFVKRQKWLFCWCGWWDLNPQGVATTGTWIVFFVADATQSTEASAKPFFWYIHWIFSFLQGGYTKLFIQSNTNTNGNRKQDIVIPKKGQLASNFIITFTQLLSRFYTTL